MVQLNIYSYRGNHNSRFFSHVGYLGLTPVKVDGIVRTKLDDDGKPLLASSLVVSVRCIELRHGHVRVVHSNVLAEYNQVLWSKSDDAEYGELGNSEHHFKIVIPTKTPGFSCANFQDYRVFWRVEAVITHAPIFGVGTRQVKGYEIPLLRYDTSVPRRQLDDASRYQETHKLRAPVLRYRLTTPTDPIGPSDIVSVPLTLVPIDPSVTVRSVSLVVERRIQLTETTALPVVGSSRTGSVSPYSTCDADEGSSSTIKQTDQITPVCEPAATSSTLLLTSYGTVENHVHSTTTLASTNTADSMGISAEQRPLLQPITTDFPEKTVTLTVHAVDGIGPFSKDAEGAYSKTLTFQWPALRPNSHWAMGETMQTEMVAVRFFLHVKVIVSSSYSSAETIELEERELYLVSTNESERKVATAKYHEIYARSKSKSPKRGKRGQPLTPPQSPNPEIPAVPLVPHSAHPLDGTKNPVLPSKPLSPSTSSAQALRRPHTSAGPRDKSSSRMHSGHRIHHHEHHRDHADGDHRDRHEARTSSKHLSTSSFLRIPRRPGTSSSTATPSRSSPEPPSPPKKTSFLRGRSSRTEERAWTSTVRTTNSTGTSGYSSCSSMGGESAWAWGNGGNGGDVGGGCASDPGSVRAWEEELERIELQSRRVSADMLGFKRQRMSATSRPNTSTSSATSASGISLS